MIKAHQIQLIPTKKQQQFFKQSCGVSRFSYNWSLARWNDLYSKGEKTSAYSLIKELTSIKRTEFPWMLDVGKTCPQYAIHNLESAFKKMWKEKSGYPKFKKKGIKDSFVAVENKQQFKQDNYKIWIPRLGWVKCHENLRFKGNVNNVIIKRIADKWFAVVNIKVPNEAPVICENQTITGVDLGIKSLAITSEGQVFKNPKPLRLRLKSLKRKQRLLSRKQKGSNNRQKAKLKLAKLHYRVSCIRKNALHQATTAIVNSASVIVLEDLNVTGMSKNHKLAQAILDVGLNEFKKQIQYKALWQGKQVIIADRFFPSSKICSCCGYKNDNLKLSDRIFVCPQCELVIDRDLNAAINLKKYGTDKLAESSQLAKACGVGSSVVLPHSPSLRQELIIKSFKNQKLESD